jgi:hypothetical protein
LKSATILDRWSLYAFSQGAQQNWRLRYLLRISPNAPLQKSHLVFTTLSWLAALPNG